jgi:amidophosphoribosyltransferase
VKIIFQTVEDLLPVPKSRGLVLYRRLPTPGGNRVVNKAFMNFYEGKDARAY